MAGADNRTESGEVLDSLNLQIATEVVPLLLMPKNPNKWTDLNS